MVKQLLDARHVWCIYAKNNYHTKDILSCFEKFHSVHMLEDCSPQKDKKDEKQQHADMNDNENMKVSDTTIEEETDKDADEESKDKNDNDERNQRQL